MSSYESPSLRCASFEFKRITPISLLMAYLQISFVLGWYFFTTGHVLQLNITINPLFFVASLNDTSFPVMSFIFTSGFGKAAPIGNGSCTGFKAIIARAATGTANKNIFFIYEAFMVMTKFRKNYTGWRPPARFFFLSSTSCFNELMLTFNSNPISKTRELKYIRSISINTVLIDPYNSL